MTHEQIVDRALLRIVLAASKRRGVTLPLAEAEALAADLMMTPRVRKLVADVQPKPKSRQRAPRTNYEFWKRRDGDTMTAADDRERKYILCGFANWKRGRPGTLKASSVKQGDGYLITFTGISSAEAVAAEIAGGNDD